MPFDNAENEKEYVGSVPVASVRGDQSSVPQLPHISGAMPLTPIGEASREGTRMTIPVSLPPIGQDQGIDGEKSQISCVFTGFIKVSHVITCLLNFHVFSHIFD